MIRRSVLMWIRPRDLDPILAKRLKEADDTGSVSEGSEHFVKLFREMWQRRNDSWGKVGGLAIFVGSPIGFVMMLAYFASAAPREVGFLFPLYIAVLCYLNRRITRHYRAAVLTLGLPYVARTPLERAYADIVLELSKATNEHEGALARGLLKQVNGLLQSGRQLEHRRNDLREAMGAKPLVALEAEREDFLRRAAEARDPDTRQVLLQSAELCGGRIESVRALTALDSRLGVQWGLIEQTLASVHASFARMRNAPEGIGGTSVEKITETVTEIQGKTRAIEQAVEEVMQLRVG
jgi:hypothetical protein